MRIRETPSSHHKHKRCKMREFLTYPTRFEKVMGGIRLRSKNKIIQSDESEEKFRLRWAIEQTQSDKEKKDFRLNRSNISIQSDHQRESVRLNRRYH